MKFYIDELPVLFPYPKIYPEQYAYMTDLKRTLDSNGHCVLEMPSGTGKTVSLLSLIVSYQQFHPNKRKLIYCSRTVPEIEKALAELQRLMEYRATYTAPGDPPEDMLALGLSSRKNLCIHPDVSRERLGKVVDARCRDMTSAWACQKGRAEPDAGIELCEFHEELGTREPGNLIPRGVWTLEELKEWAQNQGVCPYFAARRMVCYTHPSVELLLTPFLTDSIRRHHHLQLSLPVRPKGGGASFQRDER